MPVPFLTKSDFKSAYTCASKLYYRKKAYLSTLQENDYLKFLADSGFMVETVAKAQYPQGIDLQGERDPRCAFERTRELIESAENSVIFEAAALFGKFYARVDILRRDGKTLHLIEVKSSSVDGEEGIAALRGQKGGLKSKWKPYLLDVAYQQHVLSLAFPSYTVQPWLWVVNKSVPVQDSETMARFGIARPKDDDRSRPSVRYIGRIEDLQGSKLLAKLSVGELTEDLMQDVVARAKELAALIDDNGMVQRPRARIDELYKECRTCEYRFPRGKEPERHGFAECWGTLASANPHVLDLHRVGQIGSSRFDDPVPLLLATGRASFLDLREDQLGAPGAYTDRRRLQWERSVKGGSEHLPLDLRRELVALEYSPGYPFHFLDFEACDVVLPHHAGLRPYERVAFQWSCHTVGSPQAVNDEKLPHREYLNTKRQFPNFEFARKLRECLGDKGTVFVWSPYEQTTLRMVLDQMDAWTMAAPEAALQVSGFETLDELQELAKWLEDLLGPPDEEGKRTQSPRIRDLHKLAVAHYFHPVMMGRTSIKGVLPAVWGQSQTLRQHAWFSEYRGSNESGTCLDPYKTLEPLPLGDEDEKDEDVVREGTGAIRVYQDLIFWVGVDAEYRQNREKLLKQYCKLDTAAMVMIWAHWSGKI